jgi:hypothetical protein
MPSVSLLDRPAGTAAAPRAPGVAPADDLFDTCTDTYDPHTASDGLCMDLPGGGAADLVAIWRALTGDGTVLLHPDDVAWILTRQPHAARRRAAEALGTPRRDLLAALRRYRARHRRREGVQPSVIPA